MADDLAPPPPPPDDTDSASVSPWRGRTDWAVDRTAPLRQFLSTESGSSGVLVAAIVAALIWVNIDASSYATVWHTHLSIRLGGDGVTRDLQTWINSGLMTFFFLVVGLEARREFDLGDLRDRRRVLLPFACGLVGMIVPVLVYLAVNHGGSGAHGWGVAMSTDTALALGLLSMLGRRVPDQVRIFVLTVFVVDDIAALVVIAVVYSDKIVVVPLVIAIAVFAAMFGCYYLLHLRNQLVYLALGVVVWGALLASGVDPVVAGLAIGLTTPAYTPSRTDLDRATSVVRSFREQPTSQLVRSATSSLTSSLSANERLQGLYHPWTSYAIVPLFALANAGIVINGGFLAHAYTTPITLGIMAGYLLGKPLAIVATSWLTTRFTRGRVRAPVGWAGVLGSGTIAGIGFTVTLLIADRAFHGQQLAEAKLGALSAVVVAAAVTWGVFHGVALLPKVRRARALLGDTDLIPDLVPAVDMERDHVRGPETASVTIVEYGDFECPFCGQAEPAVRALLRDADLRYVWRHLPLVDVHPHAQLAAEAAEAAAAQGEFWAMHDLLMSRQGNLKIMNLIDYARELGLDVERFHHDVMEHAHAPRIARDVDSADASGVSGTPTFFINEQRHYGAYDIATLTAAVKTARIRAALADGTGVPELKPA